MDNAAFRNILTEMPDHWGEPLSPVRVHAGSCYVPSCKRHLLYQRRLGWKREYWSEALDAGTVWHNIMALLATGTTLQTACDTIASSEVLKMVDLRTAYAAKYPDQVLDTRKQEKALSLGAMLAHAWDTVFPLPASWEVLAVEQTIQIPIEKLTGVPDSVLEGTLDLVVRDTKENKIWIADYKSLGQGSTADRAKGLIFDMQCHLYLALWNSAHPDQPAYGFIHNIIKKPTIRQTKKESFEEYVGRCLKQYDMKALKDPTQPPMIQSFVPMTRPPLSSDEEFKSQLTDVAEWHAKKLNLWRFPRVGSHPHDCSKYGRVCPYMSLCTAQPGAWYDVLTHQGFVKDTTR